MGGDRIHAQHRCRIGPAEAVWPANGTHARICPVGRRPHGQRCARCASDDGSPRATTDGTARESFRAPAAQDHVQNDQATCFERGERGTDEPEPRHGCRAPGTCSSRVASPLASATRASYELLLCRPTARARSAAPGCARSARRRPSCRSPSAQDRPAAAGDAPPGARHLRCAQLRPAASARRPDRGLTPDIMRRAG